LAQIRRCFVDADEALPPEPDGHPQLDELRQPEDAARADEPSGAVPHGQCHALPSSTGTGRSRLAAHEDRVGLRDVHFGQSPGRSGRNTRNNRAPGRRSG
jgi:hypothetical protein